MKRKCVVVGLALLGVGAWSSVSRAGTSSDANCWVANGTEACQASINYNNQSCNVTPSTSQKPKIAQAAKDTSGRAGWMWGDNNCKYVCDDGSQATPSTQQGQKPDPDSILCHGK